mmetsp:Transcript_33338/g.91975  ORF Transcript_33338/g.91975 Transcript_33338/m.91975 type:complete len:334 (+) Transcript_33338:61-1062(+)
MCRMATMDQSFVAGARASPELLERGRIRRLVVRASRRQHGVRPRSWGRGANALPGLLAAAAVLAASWPLVARAARACLVASCASRQDPRTAAFGQRSQSDAFSYYMLHKPPGIVSQRNDKNHPSVYDHFEAIAASGQIPGPPPPPRLAAVGRLDRNTSGLLIFTNDAVLNMRLCGARCVKRYVATVRGAWHGAEGGAVENMRQPYRYCRKATASGNVTWTLPAEVSVLRVWREPVLEGQPPELGDRSDLEVRIVEGRHRQIRRLCGRAGLRLFRLHRAAIGPVELGNLPEGAARPLLPEEESALHEVCGLTLRRASSADCVGLHDSAVATPIA